MKNVILLFLVSFSTSSFAQIGLSSYYTQSSAPVWQDMMKDKQRNSIFVGTAFGINYGFRLKKKRIEFTPELTYAKFYNVLNSAVDPVTLSTIQFIQFNFNTNLYLLDFGEDCNCPTFSKQNLVVKKGLFLQISPGYMYSTYQNGTHSANGSNNFHIGAGIGLDIGLSKKLTVTPLIRAKQHFNANWEDLDQWLSDSQDPDIETHDNISNIFQFEFGVTARYRLKE